MGTARYTWPRASETRFEIKSTQTFPKIAQKLAKAVKSLK